MERKRIAIYGIGGNCKWFLEQMECIECVDVVYFIQTKPEKERYNGKKLISVDEMQYRDFDFLVVTPADNREILDSLSDREDFEEKKTKVAQDFIKLCLNDKIENAPNQLVDINRWADLNPYFSVKTCEGLEYVFTSGDKVIGELMRRNKATFASNEIELFFDLSEKYFSPKDLRGDNACFLDVGGNIGTTSIYVKKVVNPNLRVVAVEPSHRNVKTFKCNCILNECEDIEIYEYGISDRRMNAFVVFDESNPGNTQIELEDESKSEEGNAVCKLMTIDDLLETYSVDNLEYLWIDTQGYEVNAIVGAKRLLQNKRIPIYMEFNPVKYETDNWDEFVRIMQKTYRGFLDIDNEYMHGVVSEHSIQELDEYKNIIEKMPTDGEWSWTNLFFF